MKAAVLWEPKAALDVRDDVRLADPGPGEVVVSLAASGLCRTDWSVQQGAISLPLPCVLGHEGAGIVEGVGSGVDFVAPGDSVILSSLPMCGRCRQCLAGRAAFCEGERAEPHTAPFEVDQTPVAAAFGTGTFAERVVVSQLQTVAIDGDIPLDLACLIGCGVNTGVGAALNAAAVTPGSSVLVIGAGGVGMAAIQGARIAGATEILAVDPVEAKHGQALGFGATHAVTPEELPGALAEVTAGEGFDFAIECVGSGASIRCAFDAIRRGGTAVVVGVAHPEDTVSFTALELLITEKRLRGSLYGSANARTEFPRLVRLWRRGQLDLEGMISQRIALHDINTAFEDLESGRVIRSVIIHD